MTAAQPLADRMLARERDAAARWFGVGLAAVPVLERFEDAGWITLLASGLGDGLPPAALASVPWLLGFAALGFAGTQVMRALAQRDRWWLLGATVAVIGAYAVHRGLALAVLVAVLALAMAAVKLVGLRQR
ncbi:MAG: hypothetical protein K1X88_12400 [Nannocystaceae bacterium]|nr:hypothetical protein [Nannocystaceae bacterium]